MTFGLSAASIAAIGVGVSAVGAGLSAAGAAGAFGGSVDNPTPTREEIEAARYARQTYNLGRKIQSPLDALARQDLRYLGSDQALANSGNQAVNQYWGQMPDLNQRLSQSAAQSGGPGSGRFWGQLGQGTAALDSGVRQANVQGRMGGLNQYIARTGQFMGRRAGDLQTGLATMTSGGAQAVQAQQSQIQAQLQNKAAANQAMGQVGGSMMSVGMGMTGMGASAAGTGSSGLDGHYIGRYMPAYSGSR